MLLAKLTAKVGPDCLQIYIYIYIYRLYTYIYSFTWGFQCNLRKRIICFATALKAFEPTTHVACHFSGASKLLVWLIPCIPVLTSQVWSLDNPGSPWWWLPNCTTSGVTQWGRPLGSKSLKSKKSPFLIAKFVWINEFEPLKTFKEKMKWVSSHGDSWFSDPDLCWHVANESICAQFSGWCQRAIEAKHQPDAPWYNWWVVGWQSGIETMWSKLCLELAKITTILSEQSTISMVISFFMTSYTYTYSWCQQTMVVMWLFANHNLGRDDSFVSSRTQYSERSIENRKIPAVKLSPVRPWPLWLWSMLHVKMVMVLMQSDGFRCNTENCKKCLR